jgi:hypothetical protein
VPLQYPLKVRSGGATSDVNTSSLNCAILDSLRLYRIVGFLYASRLALS